MRRVVVNVVETDPAMLPESYTNEMSEPTAVSVEWCDQFGCILIVVKWISALFVNLLCLGNFVWFFLFLFWLYPQLFVFNFIAIHWTWIPLWRSRAVRSNRTGLCFYQHEVWSPTQCSEYKVLCWKTNFEKGKLTLITLSRKILWKVFIKLLSIKGYRVYIDVFAAIHNRFEG